MDEASFRSMIERISTDLDALKTRVISVEDHITLQHGAETMKQDLSQLGEDLAVVRADLSHELLSIKGEFGRLDFLEEKVADISGNMIEVDELNEQFVTGKEGQFLVDNLADQMNGARQVFEETKQLRKEVSRLRKEQSKSLSMKHEIERIKKRIFENDQMRLMQQEIRALRKTVERLQRNDQGKPKFTMFNAARKRAKAAKVPGKQRVSRKK